ncbi:MAG TPA: hypothetical protein VE961_00355 [Pyrinomonadaceae bacterium]|nr:hypothetical protein [Pyrinomonadaceae bacterium]
MKRKTARVTIETERLLVISRAPQSIERWCDRCALNTTFIPIDEAAAVAGVSQRTIFRWAEADAIHLVETAAGKAMFCVESILRHAATNPRMLLRD